MGKPLTEEDIRRVIEFYGALGLETLPLGPFPKGPPFPKNPPLPGPGAILTALFHEKIEGCKKCRLAAGRSSIVFGEGNPQAALMFIGEAPGREEDRQGRPFVGDAGKLLTSLIEKMGFKRADVFIANIIKCRPEGNRVPEEDEIAACLPYLERQIEIIAPRVIMALGRVAAQTLLGTTVPIGKLRGRFFEYRGIPFMPTFHPAYLLRNRKDKVLTWQDAQLVLEKLGTGKKK